MTIFDHLSNITDKKTPWESLSAEDKKAFVPYLINRWLSMNPDFIEVVNEFQHLTIGVLSPAETYKLYLNVLPKKKTFSKYTKSKKAAKYNSDLLELLSKHFMVSELEIQDYLDILSKEQVVLLPMGRLGFRIVLLGEKKSLVCVLEEKKMPITGSIDNGLLKNIGS